jgi:DNA-binding response OmpR family regulator
MMVAMPLAVRTAPPQEAGSMILVVDDDEIMREIVSNMIRDAGFGVREAGTAEEALGMLTTESFSLVILDIRMPGIGGRGFLERYRDIAPSLDVIVLTAHPAYDTAVFSLSGGADAPAIEYLEKPVDTRKLISVVSALTAQIELGPWRIDRIRKIPYYNDKEFHLAPQLVQIFEYFLRHPNQRYDYPHIALMLTSQKMDRVEAKAMLKSQMWRLRNTLDEVSGERDVIDSINEQGFCLAIKPRLA